MRRGSPSGIPRGATPWSSNRRYRQKCAPSAMAYRLLVFDWDGTIIDSASTIADCIRDASRELGLEVPDRERASHVIGLGLHDAMRIAVPGLPAQRYPEFVESYRRHFLERKDAMLLFDGMRELLHDLSKKHVLAIATGKSRRG